MAVLNISVEGSQEFYRLLANQGHLALLEEMTELEEAEVKRMLSCWVSELEPALVYREGTLLGLTAQDLVRPILVVPVSDEFIRARRRWRLGLWGRVFRGYE